MLYLVCSMLLMRSDNNHIVCNISHALIYDENFFQTRFSALRPKIITKWYHLICSLGLNKQYGPHIFIIIVWFCILSSVITPKRKGERDFEIHKKN